MYKIIISGNAGSVSNGNGDFIESSIVDGIECDTDFVTGFNKELESLKNTIKYGNMYFDMQDDLITVVEYDSERELTEKELILLKDYTSDQLSDGIGETFKEYPCMDFDEEEVYVSPWYYGQELDIEQYKDESKM